MQMFKISRVIAVAMVACLPIACGSGSPTANEVFELDGKGATAGALGRETVTAPLASILPSPEPSPEPTNGGTKPVPEPSPSPDPGSNGGKPGPVFQPSPSPSPAPSNDPATSHNGQVPPPVTNGDTGNTPPSTNLPPTNQNPPSTNLPPTNQNPPAHATPPPQPVITDGTTLPSNGGSPTSNGANNPKPPAN